MRIPQVGGIGTARLTGLPSALSSLAISDPPGKNASPIITAKNVKTRKSQNSSQLPTTTATRPLNGSVGFDWGDSAATTRAADEVSVICAPSLLCPQSTWRGA
jgi:hypothetical protein